MKAKLILLFTVVVCLQLYGVDQNKSSSLPKKTQKTIVADKDTVVLYDKSYVDEKVCTQVKKELSVAQLILEHREKTVDWWLTVIGLLLTVFTIIFPVVGFFVGRKLYNDINADKKKLKSDISIMRRDLIRTKNQMLEEIDSYKQEAEKLIETLKLHLSKAEFIGVELDVLYNTKKKDTSAEEKESTNSKIQEIIKNKDASAFQRALALAFDSYFNNQYKEAIKRYHIVLEEFIDKLDNNQLADINYKIADSYFETGDYLKAIEYFKQCLEINAFDFYALSSLGYSYQKLFAKDRTNKTLFDKALGIYIKALPLKDNNDLILTRLAELSTLQSNYDDAIDYYNKAIDIANYNCDRLNRIECLIYNNRIDLAKIEIEQYNKINPRDSFDIKFVKLVLESIENENINIEEQFKSLKKLAGTDFKTADWDTTAFEIWLENNEKSNFISQSTRNKLEQLKELLLNWQEEKNQ